MAKTFIEFDVAEIPCSRCNEKRVVIPRIVQPRPNSPIMVQFQVPFAQMILGKQQGWLCEKCLGFIEGLLMSAGVVFAPSHEPKDAEETAPTPQNNSEK